MSCFYICSRFGSVGEGEWLDMLRFAFFCTWVCAVCTCFIEMIFPALLLKNGLQCLIRYHGTWLAGRRGIRISAAETWAL